MRNLVGRSSGELRTVTGRRSVKPAILILAVVLQLQSGRVLGDDRLQATMDAMEKRTGGRIGVAALDLSNGRSIEHRAAERFGMCSTFKFLAVAAVMARVDAKEERLDALVPYGERELLAYAPITREHVHEGGMTLEALCAAAIEYSDNTAGNLVLQRLGGPAGLTKYVRTLGDEVTRLDRTEPDLNNVSPGDPRDTTTPAAMVRDMRELLIGDRLSEHARQTLEDWLLRNTTGQSMVRAAVPAGWQVGDKTGRSGKDISNDIAIVRRPNRPPLLLCIYLSESTQATEARDATIAEVAKLLIQAFSAR